MTLMHDSWLPVSFLLHVKYTLSYRIIRFDVTPKITEQNRVVRTCKFEVEVTNNIEKKLLEVFYYWSDRDSRAILVFFTTEAIFGHLLAFLCFLNSHTINSRFVPYLAKWLTPTRWCIHNFGTDTTDIRIQINPNTNPGSLLFLILALAEVCTQTEHL